MRKTDDKIKCYACGEYKEPSNFYEDKTRFNGRSSACKECDSIRKKEFAKTKIGLIWKIYGSQKTKSKRRGHPSPNYTKSEFENWMLSQDIFHVLFDRWVLSGYDKWIKPSVDRINDNIPYVFENIRVVTWYDNNQKQRDREKFGIGTLNELTPVVSTNEETGAKKEYMSLSSASRLSGVAKANILVSIKKRRKTDNGRLLTKGLYWDYI